MSPQDLVKVYVTDVLTDRMALDIPDESHALLAVGHRQLDNGRLSCLAVRYGRDSSCGNRPGKPEFMFWSVKYDRDHVF